MVNPINYRRRKVGGIWFIRFWRVRVSFCVARAVTQEGNYGYAD